MVLMLCFLLYLVVDMKNEMKLDVELKLWMVFVV